MPHIETLTPKRHAFRILFGQRPLTHFKDYAKAIKVDLIKHDDPEAMVRGTYDFVKATWSQSGRDSERASSEEMNDALEQMLAGKALGLGLESVNFMFRISGISRIDTHQIVRQRVGVVFSQQCSGDQFWNHQSCLVEPSIGALQGLDNDRIFEDFRQATIQAKVFYSKAVDSLKISIQAARSILPHNLETFIFMHTNLSTLLFFHQKRIDDGSQTWQMNCVAQQMADEVCKCFPALTSTFERNKTRFKFQREASIDRANSFSTSLYLPNADDFDYHQRDFLYPQTKNQMHLVGPHKQPFVDQFYFGDLRLTASAFDLIRERYAELDRVIARNHYSNEEILSMGREVTHGIEADFGKGLFE